jgi:hypothetical protein
MCKWLYWRDQIVKADVTDYQELVKAMSGIDIAFYLIHSIEGSSKTWKRFEKNKKVQLFQRELQHFS